MKLHICVQEIIDCDCVGNIVTKFLNERKIERTENGTFKLTDVSVVPVEYRVVVEDGEVRLRVSKLLAILKYRPESKSKG